MVHLPAEPRKHSSAMAVKELFQDLRPLPLYVMLALTLVFFTLELVISHVTHALTLLVDSYHTLCNLIALVGCLITIKYGTVRGHPTLERRESGEEELVSKHPNVDPSGECGTEPCSDQQQQQQHRRKGGNNSERRLRNTFGWARVEVLVMLIGAVFLASLCFSLVVEAVQTLCHIGHSDEMHHPIPVMAVGALGLLLNGLCYLLIGGYTFHQGSLLHVTPSGDVVLEEYSLSHEAVRQGGRRLSARRIAAASSNVAVTKSVDCALSTPAVPPAHLHATHPLVRQGPREMMRDVIGCVLVIICAAVVLFTETGVAKYVDPLFSILSAALLLILSFPYMKESGRILLQTIPDYIDIETLKNELVQAFPSLLNVHEIHIWCLTPARVFATAHLVLRTHEDYVSIKEDLAQFFITHGVTHATIQPEFSESGHRVDSDGDECFLRCRTGDCKKRHCCRERASSSASSDDADEKVSCFGASHGHSHSQSYAVKQKRIAERKALSQPKAPQGTEASNENEHPSSETAEAEQVPSDEPRPAIESVTSSYPSLHKDQGSCRVLRHQRSFSASMSSEVANNVCASGSSGELGIKSVRQHSLDDLQQA